MSNFWEVIKHHKGVKPRTKYEYRLYYNEDGSVRCYSSEELDGDYIVVDQSTFAQNRYDVFVRDGKLVNPNRIKQYRKLVTGIIGTETLEDDVTIIGKGRHWKVKYYD